MHFKDKKITQTLFGFSSRVIWDLKSFLSETNLSLELLRLSDSVTDFRTFEGGDLDLEEDLDLFINEADDLDLESLDLWSEERDLLLEPFNDAGLLDLFFSLLFEDSSSEESVFILMKYKKIFIYS